MSTHGWTPEVAGFLASLRVEKSASDHTVRSYELDLVQFFAWVATGGKAVPVVGGKRAGRTLPYRFTAERSVASRNLGVSDLTKVSSLTVREFLAYLQDQEFSRRTIVRKLSCLRSFFRYLCGKGLIRTNPTDGVDTPRIDKRPPEFLREEEMSMLLGMPDCTTPLGLRDRALLELLYATGMRTGEVVELHLGAIDRIQGWVTIRGKGGKERTIPVGAQALSSLEAYLTRSRPHLCGQEPDGGGPVPNDRQPLFLSRRGTRLTDRSIRRILEGYIRKLALERHVSPHTIRHSFAAHLLSRGADLPVVQEMLGHRSLSSTQIYVQASPQRLREVYLRAHPRRAPGS